MFKIEENYSDFVVYVDESGDHSLLSIDKTYPVFVLAFCVFDKRQYANQVVPSVESFKFDYFGHDLVILHERDIRKRSGDFNVFSSKELHYRFMEDLTRVMTESNYHVISSVVDKQELSKRVAEQEHPYHIALQVCLERLYEFLLKQGQTDKMTHVVVERRGRKEDVELELEFRRICDRENQFSKSLPFMLRLADKKTNSSGLQFADMVARPIGIHCLNPKQNNRAFGILVEKFVKDNDQNYMGAGLNLYPKTARLNP